MVTVIVLIVTDELDRLVKFFMSYQERPLTSRRFRRQLRDSGGQAGVEARRELGDRPGVPVVPGQFQDVMDACGGADFREGGLLVGDPLVLISEHCQRLADALEEEVEARWHVLALVD